MVDEGESRSVREISSRLNIPKSTLHRILTALSNEEILSVDHSTKRLNWGPKLMHISKAVFVTSEVRKFAAPILAQIASEINETTQLMLYDKTKHKGIFTDEVCCKHAVRYHAPIGMPLPVHAGARQGCFGFSAAR